MNSAIVPHLWFDKEAKEAAELYTSIFADSKVKNVTTLKDTPSGDADVVSFELAGQPFMAISAGPFFKLNPSISFVVACATKEEVDELWGRLREGGGELMGLGEYPFSERYGWLQDKYGVSWQIMAMGNRPITQKIIPTLMFVGDAYGRAEEAMNFYVATFKDSNVLHVMRYEKNDAPESEGKVKHAAFSLGGQLFGAMDGAGKHVFGFNEAVSLMVYCENQAEIDYYWEKLSAVPEAEQCGWLKDKFGVSWQVVPRAMDKMMSDKDPAKMARVTQAFLKMKKFDLAELERAAQDK